MSIELPPLPSGPCIYHVEGHNYVDKETFLEWHEAHSARERILRARVAELEADAERYRWLANKAHKDTAYDRYGNGAHWSIGFFASDGRHSLDAAIDAARGAK